MSLSFHIMSFHPKIESCPSCHSFTILHYHNKDFHCTFSFLGILDLVNNTERTLHMATYSYFFFDLALTYNWVRSFYQSKHKTYSLCFLWSSIMSIVNVYSSVHASVRSSVLENQEAGLAHGDQSHPCFASVIPFNMLAFPRCQRSAFSWHILFYSIFT